MLRYLLALCLLVTASGAGTARDKNPADNKPETPKKAENDSQRHLYEQIETAAKNVEYAARKRNLEQLKESVQELQRLMQALERLIKTEKYVEELEKAFRNRGAEKFFPEVPQKPGQKPEQPQPGTVLPQVRIIVNGQELPPDQVRIDVVPAPKPKGSKND